MAEPPLICASCGTWACAAGVQMCPDAVHASMRLAEAMDKAGAAGTLARTQLRVVSDAPAPPIIPDWPLAFAVAGVPVPQGSKVPIYGKGRRMIGMREAGGHALAKWRKDIAAQAEISMRGRPALDGPLRVALTFSFAYPAKPRKGTAPHTWPWAPAGTTDLDKLARAVLDALKQGGAIADDSRVVGFDRLEKVWAASDEADALDQPGVLVRVRPHPGPAQLFAIPAEGAER